MLKAESVWFVLGKWGDRVARPACAAKRSSISWIFESHCHQESIAGERHFFPPLWAGILVPEQKRGDCENVKTSTRECVARFVWRFWRIGVGNSPTSLFVNYVASRSFGVIASRRLMADPQIRAGKRLVAFA